jgi:hypothetical protein
LLDNPRLTNQLLGLERRVARSGKDSIDHAPNAHDDLANAVAGAIISAQKHAARGVVVCPPDLWAPSRFEFLRPH